MEIKIHDLLKRIWYRAITNDNETIESKLNEIKNDNATCTIKHGRNSDSVCTLRSFFRLC